MDAGVARIVRVTTVKGVITTIDAWIVPGFLELPNGRDQFTLLMREIVATLILEFGANPIDIDSELLIDNETGNMVYTAKKTQHTDQQ